VTLPGDEKTIGPAQGGQKKDPRERRVREGENAFIRGKSSVGHIRSEGGKMVTRQTLGQVQEVTAGK